MALMAPGVVQAGHRVSSSSFDRLTARTSTPPTLLQPGAAVAVFTPGGKKLAAMTVARPNPDLGIPTSISGLAFGGKDGRTLFITGAGTYRLYRARLPLTGEVVSRAKSEKSRAGSSASQ